MLSMQKLVHGDTNPVSAGGAPSKVLAPDLVLTCPCLLTGPQAHVIRWQLLLMMTRPSAG